MVNRVHALDLSLNAALHGTVSGVTALRLLRKNLSDDVGDERRKQFLDSTRSFLDQHRLNYNGVAFFYRHGDCILFPLKLQREEDGGWTNMLELDGGLVFWAQPGGPTSSDSLPSSVAGLVDYKHAYEQTWAPLTFQPNDVLKVRIQYNPFAVRMFERAWNPRSYTVWCHMTPPPCLAWFDGNESLLFNDDDMKYRFKFRDVVRFFYDGGDSPGQLCFNGKVFSVEIVVGTVMSPQFPSHVLDQTLRRIRTTASSFNKCFFEFANGSFAASRSILESRTL
jgi:hypothetical protein